MQPETRSPAVSCVQHLNIFVFSLILCSAAIANDRTQRVENFVLLDHRGDAHELYYHREAAAVVLMSQDTGCPSSKTDAKALASLQKQFAQARFYLINSDPIANRSELASWAADHAGDLRILEDDTQLIAGALKIEHTGEVLVIDPQDWQLLHHGNVAEARTVLAGSGAPSGTELTNTHARAAPESIPCPISYRAGLARTDAEADTHLPVAVADTHLQRAHTGSDTHLPSKTENDTHVQALNLARSSISYSRHIAPLLQDKCVVCHTEGGLGPWAMSNYNMVHGFAPMIREVVRTKRMPPWHADPHVGHWQNDSSLSPAQARMLVHWIEAGAPRGDGPDPLADSATPGQEWPLGQPDLILDIPAYTVPASGVVDYQFPTVTNPLKTGVWVKAATVIPGDREVVHHILAGTVDEDATELRRNSGVFDNYLIGYAPGNESHQFPEGTGVFIPPGGEFLFQLHYTPVGRETVDRSRIGLYFHHEVPDNYYRQGVVIDPTIRIPAEEARHAETAYYEFANDALLHDLVPHAHYRGVATKFELWHPNGEKELILNVPNYDFNWQRTYEFVVPKPVTAGTRLVHTTLYDNSAANPGNPNPQREVPWGLQSWDEMLYGAFSYTLIDESTEAPIHDKFKSRTSQYIGFLDQNIDGKLSWRELPRQIKKRLVQGFKMVDTNGDGGLDLEEMHVLTTRLREAEAREERTDAEPG
ncbi:MAG: redoxin domain-containing protein [Pseudomonadota bacterium]